jgi:peptidoglycan/xylan/chitin deacetylase (PgdA/CDA1 family)
MGVLILMYHRTPREAGHWLDTPMPLFRSQMQTLQSAGVRFIHFGQALESRWYSTGRTVVCVTFDDGHGSNLEAMAFLHDAGIPCTSFFVSDFVRNGQDGFMDAAMFKEACALCEVGAHGASHTKLTGLEANTLTAELLSSKRYLEDLSERAVTTMSAPGGMIDQRVVHMALEHGYKVVGDSVALLNQKPELPLHRYCMVNGLSPELLHSLVSAGPLYWMYRRLRLASASAAAKLVGEERFQYIRRKIKGENQI